VLLDKSLDFGHLLGLEAEVHGQLNVWVNPELRFTVGMLNVNVRAPFFTGKEIQPKASHPKNCRTHRPSIAECQTMQNARG